MKKVKNLAELESLIGCESVEKCFMEYILTIIGQAKRLEDLQNHCAVMDEDEMSNFVQQVGCKELYAEMKERPSQSPRYFKAVQATLLTLGYDERWVNSDLIDALKKEYLK